MLRNAIPLLRSLFLYCLSFHPFSTYVCTTIHLTSVYHHSFSFFFIIHSLFLFTDVHSVSIHCHSSLCTVIHVVFEYHPFVLMHLYSFSVCKPSSTQCLCTVICSFIVFIYCCPFNFYSLSFIYCLCTVIHVVHEYHLFSVMHRYPASV